MLVLTKQLFHFASAQPNEDKIMALGANTNISSLTAQRAVCRQESCYVYGKTVTGLRINTLGRRAGLAVAERMTSQIELSTKRCETRTRTPCFYC